METIHSRHQKGGIFVCRTTPAVYGCVCGILLCQKLEGIEYDVREPMVSAIRRDCDRQWRLHVGYIICERCVGRRKIDEKEGSMSERCRSRCGSARVLNRFS